MVEVLGEMQRLEIKWVDLKVFLLFTSIPILYTFLKLDMANNFLHFLGEILRWLHTGTAPQRIALKSPMEVLNTWACWFTFEWMLIIIPLLLIKFFFPSEEEIPSLSMGEMALRVVVEELLFRIVPLYVTLCIGFSAPIFIIAAILFGLCHGLKLKFIIPTIGGIIWGFLILKYGIFFVFLCHFLWNLCVFAAIKVEVKDVQPPSIPLGKIVLASIFGLGWVFGISQRVLSAFWAWFRAKPPVLGGFVDLILTLGFMAVISFVTLALALLFFQMGTLTKEEIGLEGVILAPLLIPPFTWVVVGISNLLIGATLAPFLTALLFGLLVSVRSYSPSNSVIRFIEGFIDGLFCVFIASVFGYWMLGLAALISAIAGWK
jgi:hypothetical protein